MTEDSKQYDFLDQTELDKPKKRGRPKKTERKNRESNSDSLEPVRAAADPKKAVAHCPTLEELAAMPLNTHEDYLAYNEAVRNRRRVTRKKDVEYLYAPLDKVKCHKVRVTRTHNRGQPIHLNLRKLDKAVWYRTPKPGLADGAEVELPECIINDVNKLAEPKYKQITYPDGSFETVLDYWDNKYSCQVVMGD